MHQAGIRNNSRMRIGLGAIAGGGGPSARGTGAFTASTDQDGPITDAVMGAAHQADGQETPVEHPDTSVSTGLVRRPTGATLSGAEISELTAAFPDFSSARELLSVAGFPRAYIPDDAPTIRRFWEKISEELFRGASTDLRDRLLSAPQNWNPGNPSLPDVDAAYGADFFISYVAADRRWAEWISWVLEQAGFRVKSSVWEKSASANLTDSIQDRGTRAKHMIMVLSEAYTRLQSATAAWRADAELFVVRVEDCSRPGARSTGRSDARIMVGAGGSASLIAIGQAPELPQQPDANSC